MTLPDVGAALYTKLNNASGITSAGSTGIYALQAPGGASLPFVIYYLADGRIPNTEPRDTLDEIYRVESRATAASTSYAIHAAVYAALHEQEISISGWTNYWLVCERQQHFVETTGGKQYYRNIWDVRLKASKD